MLFVHFYHPLSFVNTQTEETQRGIQQRSASSQLSSQGNTHGTSPELRKGYRLADQVTSYDSEHPCQPTHSLLCRYISL